MSHLIKAMEQLGSNPALKAKVLVNGLKTLQNMGVKKTLSLALLANDLKTVGTLTRSRQNMVCFISTPPGNLNTLSHQFIIDKTMLNLNLRTSKLTAA